MEIRAFFVLVVPFIIVFYLAVLLFMRPPRSVVLPSLLGGLIAGIINLLFDLGAYYAHLWHYTLNDLILHLPLPFYVTPFLIYGSLAYLVIWRFWQGRGRWAALLVLYGLPIFGIVRDILGVLAGASYATWDSWLAAPADIIMWLLMFYAGYRVFRRLAPSREEVLEQENALENVHHNA